jgi:transposase
MSQAQALIQDYDAEFVLADKGYDSAALVEQLHVQGAQAVIPSRRGSKAPRVYDLHIYKQRHAVERLIGKLKHYRRLFSRFDKLDASFTGFLSFAAALIWLR